MPAPNPARHGGAKKKDAMKADGVLERQSERPLGRHLWAVSFVLRHFS